MTSLKIDTSVAQVAQLHRANTDSESHSPSSARPFSDNSPRDPLSSPTASALTMMSATASSAHASTSSLLLPQAPSIYSETTVDTHLSADMSFYERPQPEYVLAMHDYIPDQRNATCLGFCAGQVIRVLNRDSSGWWDGELDGSRGWFPSNYVNGDFALLADEHLTQFVSVRSFILSNYWPGIELTYYMHYSESEHDILLPILPSPPPPIPTLVSIRLDRTLTFEMIIARLQWFHYFMHCHCCKMLSSQIG